MIVKFIAIFLLLINSSILMAKPLQLVASVAVDRLGDFTLRSLLSQDQIQTQSALLVEKTPTGIVFNPTDIFLTMQEKIFLRLVGLEANTIEVYPRDDTVVRWDRAHMSLTAVNTGETEIIFIIAGKLHILPIRTQKMETRELAQGPADDLQMPEITGLDNLPSGHSLHGEAFVAPRRPVSLEDGRAGRFIRHKASISYRDIEIQLIDERSGADTIYPIGGLQVRLTGSILQLRTNGQGIVSAGDVPVNSRLMITFSDPQGRYIAGAQEILVRPGIRRYRIVALRDLAFATMNTITGQAQNQELASMCGEIDEEGDYTIEVDAPVAGVYYFNHLGLLDPRLRATTYQARFCLLNVDPGPLTIFVSDGNEQRVGTFTVGLLAGHHTEEHLSLADSLPFRTWVATSAEIYLPADVQDENNTIVDFVQMRMIGEDNYLTKVEDGLLESPSPDYHRGRSFVLVHDAEFEPVLYQISPEQQPSTTPLFPRGFVESMALLVEETYDPTKGAVVVEHGKMTGQGEDIILLRLINQNGVDMQGNSFQEDKVTRGVFLNLDYGVYQLIVQTRKGDWLSAQTLMVYDETISWLRTGSSVSYVKGMRSMQSE